MLNNVAMTMIDETADPICPCSTFSPVAVPETVSIDDLRLAVRGLRVGAHIRVVWIRTASLAGKVAKAEQRQYLFAEADTNYANVENV
jgi:hypothetical protein